MHLSSIIKHKMSCTVRKGYKVYPERTEEFSKDQKIMKCKEARLERLSFMGSLNSE